MKVRSKVIMLVVTLVVILGTFLATLKSDNRPVLGLDLQGGISIVLFPVDGQDLSALDTAVDIIRNRVDALGIAEPEVNRQGNTIVIDLPGVKDREQAEALVGQTAELRFRVVNGCYGTACTAQAPAEAFAKLATADGSATTAPADASSTTAPPADASSTTVPAESTPTSGDASGGETISTAPIAAMRPAQEASTTVAPTSAAPSTTVAPTTTAAGGSTTTTTLPSIVDTCSQLIATRDENVESASVWLPVKDDNNNGRPDEGCLYLGPSLMTGRDVKSASKRYSPEGGGPWVVDIDFKNDDFVNLVATPNVGNQVGIELDGVVQSYPTINQGITGRTVQITGGFSEGEAKGSRTRPQVRVAAS